MIALFLLKVDSIQFFNALFLIISAAICFLIFETKRKDLFWQDFRWFFIFQGLNQLLVFFPSLFSLYDNSGMALARQILNPFQGPGLWEAVIMTDASAPRILLA